MKTKIVGILVTTLLIAATVLPVAGMENLSIKNNLDFDAKNISNINEIDQLKVSNGNRNSFFSDVMLVSHASTKFNQLQQPFPSTIRGVPFPYPTIQEAVDASSSGDIVLVLLPGTYVENVFVFDVSVTIMSLWGSASTTVQALDPNGAVFYIMADNVKIKGFTITGSDAEGIVIDGTGSSNNEIIKNVIFGNEHGIRLSSSDKSQIKNNKIFENTRGIFILWSSENKIINNEISENTNYGIYLTRLSNNNQIKNNILSNNFYGIHIFSEPSNNQIACNDISNNQYGINIREYSSDNKIYLNDFIGNSVNAYTDETCLNNWNSPNPINYFYQWKYFTSNMGNYWDDYTGTSGSNGIGTTPYVIEISNIDNYPLVDPVKNYIGACSLDKIISKNLKDSMQKDNNIQIESHLNLFPILQRLLMRL